MTYRVAADIKATALPGINRRALQPHLICSWTLDPASRRLSCAWATPAAELGAGPSSRITAAMLSAGFALQPQS
jgi:hypothetical protein